jgi:hypothetical protein
VCEREARSRVRVREMYLHHQSPEPERERLEETDRQAPIRNDDERRRDWVRTRTHIVHRE